MVAYSFMCKVCRPLSCLAWLALLAGCGPSDPEGPQPPPKVPAESSSIRLLVIDDPDLAKKIQEQWRSRFSYDGLEIRTANQGDLANAKRLSADVVVFPADRMGELAESGLIQPLPETPAGDIPQEEEPSSLPQIDNLLPTIRQCDVSWGRKVYAVPLGSPQFVLLYRPDVFERLQLSPPATWREFQGLAEKLTDRAALGDLAPDEGESWHATLEPLAGSWAGVTLLARAASAVRTEGQLYTLFDLDNMAARIGEPPYVRASQELAASAKGFDGRRLTPAEVREAFFRGECAMAITWPSAADAQESETPVAFAELPGSSEWYHFEQQQWLRKADNADQRASLCAISGRLAAVTREARRSRSAFQLLTWLSSDEASQTLGATTPQATLFAKSQLATAQQWVGPHVSAEAAVQYAEVAESSFGRAAWMPAVRIPGVNEYNAALEKAMATVLENPEHAQSALDAAAKAWDAITKKRGLQSQRRAYQRSLGNDF